MSMCEKMEGLGRDRKESAAPASAHSSLIEHFHHF